MTQVTLVLCTVSPTNIRCPIMSTWHEWKNTFHNLYERTNCRDSTYRKIPKISPGAYIFQRPCLRGLFLEGPIFGGAYVRREICVSKLIGLACSGKEIYHFCFVLLCIRGTLMKCICPLVSLLCRVGKHFLHSYDSTTITKGLLLIWQATKFPLSPLNEIHLSTRQPHLSSRIMSRVLSVFSIRQ